MFFKHKVNVMYLLLVFSLFLAACSRTAIARNSPPPDTPELMAKSDTAANLIDALATAGAPVEMKGDVTQPFFSVTGQVVSVNGNEVQLFVYDDEVTAESEAGQVSPDGTAVGPNIMMWMATPHFYRFDKAIALYLGDDEVTLTVLEEVFGPQFAGGQSAATSDEIGEAALIGLEQIGWDVAGFSAETVALEDDYARVTITSINPPGGFAAFMRQQDGEWILLTQGSAFNPAELQVMGIPDALIEWRPTPSNEDSDEDIGGAALAGLEAIGWDVEGFSAEVTAVDGDYASVTVHSTNPPGGFTAFMMRQDGQWTVVAHGSAYNPEELKAMGFSESVLP